MDRQAGKSPADPSSFAATASRLPAKYVATKELNSISDSPTWFLTSFDARKNEEKNDCLRSKTEDEHSTSEDGSSTSLSFRKSTGIFMYQVIEGRGSGFRTVESTGKWVCGGACVLAVFAVALAVKLAMRKNSREYS